MDAALFAQMLSDSHLLDLKKLGYKYPQADLKEFIALLGRGFYQPLPLRDFEGRGLVYLEGAVHLRLSAARLLLTPQSGSSGYSRRAMEEEILSTFAIEQVDTSRESVRRILSGLAPAGESEQRVLGMKQGLEFIADPSHPITEENLHRLYQLVIEPYLPEEDRLPPGSLYRQDSVYIVGAKLEHTGLPWQKLPEYMAEWAAFAGREDGMNDLLKAAVLHFALAYFHPYFDGNGRMARLVHLWYLVQRGYPSALFVPLSDYIQRSRRRYYQAYTLIEQNASISGVLDVTPFLDYFIQWVYHQMDSVLPPARTTADFQRALDQGRVTEKEKALWNFVLSAYGTGEFSTKQLEKDFGGAAYATIRGFVQKFQQLGLLRAVRYGSRTKYQVQNMG